MRPDAELQLGPMLAEAGLSASQRQLGKAAILRASPNKWHPRPVLRPAGDTFGAYRFIAWMRTTARVRASI